jgi:hypothetical protein
MKHCCLNLERRVVGEHSERQTEMGGQNVVDNQTEGKYKMERMEYIYGD